MLFRLLLILVVVFYFFVLISKCAHASEDSVLIMMLVERDGVTSACARASLADEHSMPRELLPRNLRESCMDEEILALARGLAELSVNVREYSVGTRLHVAVDKDGRVFAIYLVDDETGEFIPGGHILD